MSDNYEHKVVIGSNWDEFFENLEIAYSEGWNNAPPSLSDEPRIRHLVRTQHK